MINDLIELNIEMQSMIATQQQLIRRSINLNNNNNESNDNKSNNSNESLKPEVSPKQSESIASSGSLQVSVESIGLNDVNDSNSSPSVIRKSTEKINKKKRSTNSWLNILNPTYKTRHEEFKRLFNDLVPNNERLVVDYSCALQKEILVHGRLYLSLNYISFYANIFKWETSLVSPLMSDKQFLITFKFVLKGNQMSRHKFSDKS